MNDFEGKTFVFVNYGAQFQEILKNSNEVSVLRMMLKMRLRSAPLHASRRTPPHAGREQSIPSGCIAR
jgi:hypothetical protein